MREGKRNFADDFVVDPRLAVGGPRIRFRALEVASVEKILAKEDVTPKINVRVVF